MTAKRIVSILLCMLLCVSAFLVSCGEDSNTDTSDASDEVVEINPAAGFKDFNDFTVAYIPLDDRPVQTDRVKYLAESAGITLKMPVEDDYRTILDAINGVENARGGNTKNLLNWLKEQEQNGVNCYIISLDQIFSGGLVNSRVGNNGNTNLDESETEIANYLVELAKNNYVVYLDTVMRLASTNGYKGYNLNEYYATRAYGSQLRATLPEEELTIENIVAGYRYGANDMEIPLMNVSVETGAYCTATEEQISEHLAARERKLNIITYLIEKAGKDIEHLIVGVDDSSANENIQYNERAYIEKIASSLPKFNLFAGADELGMMGIATLTSSLYAKDGEKGNIPVNVVYYGMGQNEVADHYDYLTLKETVDRHLSAIGAKQSDDTGALQVLILTRQSSLDSKDLQTNAKELVEQLKKNLEANIPTCVIDASNANGGNARVLSDCILSAETPIPVGKSLAISCWNTVSNTVGIGLSNAVARYNYIKNSSDVSDASNVGFLKTMTFALIKDASYRGHGSTMSFESTANYDDPLNIIKNIEASQILGKDIKPIDHGKKITVSDIVLPWNRAFECRFTINVQ